MAEKNRPLYILKYLLDNTDEEHPAVINDILAYLETRGIHANRKTIAVDLLELQDSGFDVVCNKSRQNKYFIGSRSLELAELKTVVDAVQAAKFISPTKSLSLIEKLSALASPYQAEELKRRLYVEGKVKTSNESVYYTVDLLHHAINHERTVEFQYSGYTVDKEKVLRHGGAIYRLSPYDLVWDNDRYYVFGWSERHCKVVKFRVDRMLHAKESLVDYHKHPDDYDIEAFCNQVFLMYDGEQCAVQLLCNSSMMNTIIDRFGDDVKTEKVDDQHFMVDADVFISPTFFSWVFAYGDAMRIISPKAIKKQYADMLKNALEQTNFTE
jgi:predicted DNA-binding transcriptional regulator YafY